MSESKFLPSECDVIMEGGVTSGVVFPSFLARLASRFTLRSIGGTSVGAVAAVAAAAAQFKRNATTSKNARNGEAIIDDGFDRLAELPEWFQKTSASGQSNLFSLFQPCRDLQPHFKLLQNALNRSGFFSTAFAVIKSLPLYFPRGAIFGILLAFASYAIGAEWFNSPSKVMALQMVILSYVWLCISALLSAVIFALVEFVWIGLRGLRRNRCGICPGIRETNSGNHATVPALTEWLHDLVQEIAGLPKETPLTFGTLRASSPSIELAFISTGISEMRSHRLPSMSKDLLFRVSDMQKLFPASIVNFLIAHSTPLELVSERSMALLRIEDPKLETPERDLYFMPDADQWPIVFAARLSLSFPVLLQAVPLYRLRYVNGDGVTQGAFTLKRIWLSDGGLTSNFPIHFFDSLLPTRPTFGISLENTLAEKAPASERVSLPNNNTHGLTGSFIDIDQADGLPSIGGFAGALLGTIRTWRDQALKRTPGFRDRIVQIRHTKSEGGLNLNMPHSAIKAMSESGTVAADLIIERFLTKKMSDNGWLNHRWVRMRSAAALLQEQLRPVAKTWSDSSLEPSYQAIWNETIPDMPPVYKLTSSAQRIQGNLFWTHLVDAANNSLPEDLTDGAPNPRPSLQISPKQT